MGPVIEEYLAAGFFLLLKPAQRFLYETIIPKGPGPKRGRSKMALTRKFLRTMDIEDDKVDQIIEAIRKR